MTAGPWLAKPKRRTFPRVASDAMTSCRARRMSEGRLKREYVHTPLYSGCGMAVPTGVSMSRSATAWGGQSDKDYSDLIRTKAERRQD